MDLAPKPRPKMQLGNTLTPLSDFVALAAVDDWLTCIFVDSMYPSLSTMKMEVAEDAQLRPQCGHIVQHAMEALNAMDNVHTVTSKKARRALSITAAVHFITKAFTTGSEADKMRAYLSKVMSLQFRSSTAITILSARNAFPAGFTDRHVRTLIRYEAYSVDLFPGS